MYLRSRLRIVDCTSYGRDVTGRRGPGYCDGCPVAMLDDACCGCRDDGMKGKPF